MFHNFRCERCKGHWSVVFGISFGALFKDAGYKYWLASKHVVKYLRRKIVEKVRRIRRRALRRRRGGF